MMRQAFLQEYQTILTQSGLEAHLACADAFYEMTAFLLQTNEQFNLTSVTDPHQVILRHYADCIAVSRFFAQGARVIDVGCGAGFPTLPLAVVRPDLAITALDSTAKKLTFVAACAERLGLRNVTTVAGRAEEVVHQKGMREAFDIATARAVSRLCVLDELCLPFVRVGGMFLSLKGENGAQEAAQAQKGVRMLGGNRISCINVPVSDGEETLNHILCAVEKVAPTPQIYPRNYARISKKPL